MGSAQASASERSRQQAEADDARSLDRVRIGEALVREGVLSREQLDFALRVQAKLRYHERLGKVIEQLQLVDPERLRNAIHRLRRSLGIPEILLDLGLLSRSDLERAERIRNAHPSRSVEKILVARRLIDEDALVKALSEKFDLPIFTPRMEEIDEALLQDEALAELKKLGVLPLRRGEGEPIRVAISDPRDEQVRRVIEALFGDQVQLLLATPSQIDPVLAAVEIAHRATSDPATGQKEIVDLLNDLIESAQGEGASDIHIEPLANSVRVRFRVDGLLVRRFEFPKSVHSPLISRIKVLSEADIAERRRHQGGRMIVSSGDQQLDVRVSFYVSIHGETAVLRILTRRHGVLEVSNLGLAPLILRRYVEDVLEGETGIIILTGPTGSGKTTTLSSSISALNHIDTKIITAEDPVEYQIDGVTQCQINPQIGLTYEETLRAIVRQDPDVIVLGEVRDEFSGGVAVQAALTGHKVFTTLHTEDSVGALLRLINMNIKPFFVASTVQGVVAQRLVRQICQKCSQPYSPSRDEIRRSGVSARDVRRYEFKRGVGCDDCSFSGYRGRIGFFELLTPNDQTRDQLMTNPTSSTLRDVALRSAGLVSLREDGLAKAALGLTTLGEVYRHTPRVETVRDMGAVFSLLGY
jgi:type IV pilus assembly protein PilB